MEGKRKTVVAVQTQQRIDIEGIRREDYAMNRLRVETIEV
jgi:hypothetical protein